MATEIKQTQTKPEISSQILIEDLVDNYPFSVRYLMENGIRCIMCGEPIWGTLDEAAREKGFTDEDVQRFISEMKALNEESLQE
jgi:hypothetical protein